MYRLTFSDHNALSYRKTYTHLATHVWQRVYRWENKWGTHVPSARWEDVWRAEIRTQIASDGDSQLFERVIPIADAAPPNKIDDVWEEQVMYKNHVTCGNLLSITGTLFEIQDCIRRLNIVVAPSICETFEIEAASNNSLQPPPPQDSVVHQSVSRSPAAMIRDPSQRPVRSESQRGGFYPRGHARNFVRPQAYDPQGSAQQPSQGRTFRNPQYPTSGRRPTNEVQYVSRR